MKMKAEKKTTLKNRVDDIAPLLELEGEWTHDDIEGNHVNTIRLLKKEGVITPVRMEYVDRDAQDIEHRNIIKTSLNVWQWDKEAKEWLQEYLNDRNELPCNHRSHICNPSDIDGYSCQYCRDDPEKEMPVYDKETVKQCL